MALRIFGALLAGPFGAENLTFQSFCMYISKQKAVLKLSPPKLASFLLCYKFISK